MEATSLALDHLMRAVGNPLDDLHGVVPGHAEYERAQLIRIAAGVLAKTPHAFAGIEQAIAALEGPPLSPQTLAHLAAARAWISGDPVLAAESYAAVLEQWPLDLLALRLAQSCFFYLGWHDRLCALVDAVLPAWPHDRRGYGFVLAIASYAHAESGDAAYAEKLGRQSLALDPACPLGVHAVAHALAESGRSADGARWMRERVAHWAAESRMRTHNAWHLAMFDAMEGNLVSALGIVDGWLLPAGAHSVADACDATALLWRLATLGVEVGSRWGRISDAFDRNMTPGFWPYVDLHAAFAHWNAGEAERLRSLSGTIDACAEGSDYAALRARHITRPGLQALRAWTDGRHDHALELFAGVRPRLGQMGGSRAQLEIFSSIEQQAVRRARHCGGQARRAA